MEMKSESGLMTFSSYKGKNDLYNIVKIETEYINPIDAREIKGEFVQYFGDSIDEQLEGCQNNLLDLANIKKIDDIGLPAILVFNRLNMNKYKDKKISIINCADAVNDYFRRTQLNAFLDVYKNNPF